MYKKFITMMSAAKKPVSKNQKGMSLIELIVVIALVAVFLAVTAIMVTKGRLVGNEGKVSSELDIISGGISEHKMYKGVIPTGATWAAAGLNAYVPAEITAKYLYSCAPAGFNIITTPAYESVAAATAALSKLKDSGVCAATSALNGSKINCTLKSYEADPCP